MSHPNHRKARHPLQPAWWLLPVAVSLAAIAAVAVGASQEGEPFAGPLPAAVAAPMPYVPAALPPLASDTPEAGEHVQAF